VQQTRLIATGAVGDQGFCDGFKPITCSKSSPTTVAINSAMWKGDRLRSGLLRFQVAAHGTAR